MARRSRDSYSQNRLQQLRGFCHAAQTLSISKAAERMGRSQPSVSLQIQALERELGTVLFERKGPKIQLTPDGAKLYEMALPLVEGFDTLPADFRARTGSLEHGHLDVAAGESTLLYLLPRFIQQFQAQYPGIDVRLHNVTGRDGLAMLRGDEVDFAVGSMLDVPDDITYRPSFSYDPMLITAPHHPLARKQRLTLKDISAYGLVLPPRHLSTWRAVRMVFDQHELPFSVRLEAGGWEVIKKYVALDLGISIVTGICLEGDEPLHTRSLARYFPKRSYGVVLRRGKFLAPQARRFIELLDPQFFAKRGSPLEETTA